ncbi:Leucine-rich repeat protein [Seminavis robusta]|uniref:Leucine-rich repeat protein n=1 Tax=Seminavis robusta TaxID=568900 RepID=A0A9N8EHV3_9STRA|nr:Leucine-rich repeat protein [Seminavis robusta]|eukprot:Sro1103_g241660.1 Leucine-rich repeat protein (1237) ;mRNA; f:1157-4934
MVKLVPDPCGCSGIGWTPPTYLVSEEATIPQDSEDPSECQQQYPYDGGVVSIQTYSTLVERLKEIVKDNRDYIDGYYNKYRKGKEFSWSHFRISLTTTKKETEQNTSNSEDPDETERPEDEEETEERKEKKRHKALAKALCDPKPGVTHASLQIYISAQSGDIASSSQWCEDIEIHERTGRPEDLIDLLLECQPAQLDFKSIDPSLAAYLAEKIATTNTTSLQVIGMAESCDEGTIQAMGTILQSCCSSTNPQTLRLYECYNSVPYHSIQSGWEEGFRCNTSIQTLDLGQVDMSEEGFAEFVAAGVTLLQNLKGLDLSGTNGFVDHAYDSNPKPQPPLDPLVEALSSASNKKSSLTTINLNGCRIPEEFMDQLMGGICTLSSSLKDLNLSQTKCGSNALAAVGDMLQKDGCALEVLDLTSLDSPKQAINVSSIIRALSKNASLTTLKIGGNEQPAGGMKELAEALSKNTSLANLHLDTVYSIDDGFKIFFSMLSTMKGLVLLDISDNAMTDEALEILISQLESASDELSIRQIEATDMQSSESALERLSKAVSTGSITVNVSELEGWETTDSLLLVPENCNDIVVPPKRYGEGTNHVGTVAFMTEFLKNKIATFTKKEGKQPSDLAVSMGSLDSEELGVRVGWTEHGEDLPLTIRDGRVEDFAKVLVSLGVSAFHLEGELPDSLLVALQQDIFAAACTGLTLDDMIVTKTVLGLLKNLLWCSKDFESLELRRISNHEEDFPPDSVSESSDEKLPEGALKAMKTLKLERLKLAHPVTTVVREILLSATALEKLEFKCIGGDDDEPPPTHNIIGPDEALPTGSLSALKVVTLDSVKITNPVALLLKAILSSSSSALELIKLSNVKCDDLEPAKIVGQGYAKNRSVRTVEFQSVDEGISDAIQAALLTGLASLNNLEDLELKLQVCGNETVEALASIVGTSKSRKLSILFGYSCGSVDITPISLRLAKNTSMLELSVLTEGKYLADPGVASLGQALAENTTLETFHVVVPNLTFDGASVFYSHLGSMKGLKHLHFDGNYKGKARDSSTLSDTALEAFVQGLTANSSIQELSADYAYWEAAEVNAGIIKLLQSSLPTTLTSIAMKMWGGINDDHAQDIQHLFGAMATNTTITNLAIEFDCDQTLDELGKALIQNSKLETLVVTCSYLSKESVDKFAKSLCDNGTLKHLRFNVRDEEVKQLLVDCTKETSIKLAVAENARDSGLVDFVMPAMPDLLDPVAD